MGSNFWLEILNGTWLGDFEGFLVGNCDFEVLGPSYGFLVGRSAEGCLSVHRIGLGSSDLWILVFWWAWWKASCLEVPKPRLLDHFDRYSRSEV